MPKKSALQKSIESFAEALQERMAITGLGGLLLGFLSAVLVSRTVMIPRTVTQVFLGALAIIIVIWFLARALKKKEFERSRWGSFGLLLFGYGLGAFLYEYRAGVNWIWDRLLTIDSTSKVLLAALFLFGFTMGFFVVRNWSKEQEDFQKSVLAAVGGALLTPLLGKFGDGAEAKVEAFTAFVYYFLGFAISGVINLVVAALLTASYSNKKTIASRTVLSFLYGGDKAEAVDKQFLKNFEEDPIYARRLLINTVLEYEKKVLREYANKREAKRLKQESETTLRYYQLVAIECQRPPSGGGAQTDDGDAQAGGEAAQAGNEAAQAGNEAAQAGGEAAQAGNEAAQAGGEAAQTAGAAAPGAPLPPDEQISETTKLTVVVRRVEGPLSEKMFRSAVSLKWQDNLEYIDAAGAYTKSFPYFGSVAGLAICVLQTIVMDRDKYKRFRTSEHPHGLCPAAIEQRRGLGEIDYLSYIAVPVASCLGQPEQTRLGVLHIDTKLFAAEPKALKLTEEDKGIRTATLSPAELTEFASKLYEQDDPGVRYLEEMRAVLVPVLQLYLRCRQGSA